MPTMPLPRCKVPGCKERARAKGKTLCAAHATEAYREQATLYGRDPYYGTADWERRRKRILERDPFCVACKAKGKLEPSRVADHIVPRAKGGSDDESNLQGLCFQCHSRKTIQEQRA